jgi:hypothetical protein
MRVRKMLTLDVILQAVRCSQGAAGTDSVEGSVEVPLGIFEHVGRVLMIGERRH